MKCIGLISLLVLLFACVFVQATWVTWEVAAGGNGHRYQAVPGFDGLTWTLADELARAEGGYLATITSAAENDFVFGLVNTPEFWTDLNGSGPALGGLQQDGATEPTGGWYWTTGESWNYSNWLAGQPDNWPGTQVNENRLQFYSRSAMWNDLAHDDTNLGGFVIEIESVPEAGSTIGLLALVIALLAVRPKSWVYLS